MKNTFGTNVSVTVFGESHGPAVGAVLDGMAPGIEIDYEYIKHRLKLRAPVGSISTSRREDDDFEILSGVFNGKTTGTPICIVIKNKDVKSKDYSDIKNIARPGHADYTANVKYHGFQDYRGGGHFSGRITAALVAAGAIAATALKNKGIYIGTHIKSLGDIDDIGFSDYRNDIDRLNEKQFAAIDDNIADAMKERIESVAKAGDSIGGVLETAITGVPAGVGEPFFDTVEGVLSHALFAIPAIKGVWFGNAYDMRESLGSEYNDEFYIDGKEQIATKTNNNGGINGGITNGMPIIFSCAVKPTPSICKKQNTVNFESTKETELIIQGRHDPAVIHRARAVVDSVAAIVICDMLSGRFGTDYLR
ncbi:MAG: chorismate synthase [Clostridiales bacterium]|nr:chorismate synthase [Clostridiales bacterium]